MIFVYIIAVIGIILMTSGIIELASPKLVKYISKDALELIDRVLYKMSMISIFVMLAIIFIFIAGGLIGLTLI